MTAVALAGVACTGNGTDPTTTPGTPTETIPTGPVRVVQGEFELEHVGVVVHLSWEGTTGTMTIENGSDLNLEVPSLSVITQQATTEDVDLPGAVPLAPGESTELEITFPVPLEDMGLVELSFGAESWGLLSPVVEAA